jgi:uncharacterized protein (DUF433 family)
MADRKLSVKEIVKDLESGATDADLRKKYRLSEDALRKVFAKLLTAGSITEFEMANRFPEMDEQAPPEYEVQAPEPEPPRDKKISAKDVAAAIRSGMTDSELMKKYGISQAVLQKWKKALSERAAKTAQKEIRPKPRPAAQPPAEPPKAAAPETPSPEPAKKTPGPPPRSFKCPNCSNEYIGEVDECPHCGIILAKLRRGPLSSYEPPEEETPVEQPRKKSGLLFAAVGLAALVLLGGGGFFAWEHFTAERNPIAPAPEEICEAFQFYSSTLKTLESGRRTGATTPQDLKALYALFEREVQKHAGKLDADEIRRILKEAANAQKAAVDGKTGKMQQALNNIENRCR